MLDLSGFYEAEKLEASKCYETCGGGHCCKLFSLFSQTRFTSKDSLLLYLYPFELDWLKANNQFDAKFDETLKKNEFAVDGKKLFFYTVDCSYGGLCPNHKHRPLSCFLYPYFPYFDSNGKIVELVSYSIYDDFYDALGMKKPCTLFGKWSIDVYQQLVDKFLADEQFYFYTNLYVRFKNAMLESYLKQRQENDLEKCIAEFEMLYVMRKLLNPDEAAAIVREEDAKFKFLPHAA